MYLTRNQAGVYSASGFESPSSRQLLRKTYTSNTVGVMRFDAVIPGLYGGL